MNAVELFIYLFSFAIMVVGLLGSVLPSVPGIHLVWFGVFLSAVATGFAAIDQSFLAITGVLVLLTYVLEFWSMRWNLKQQNVTPFAVAGAVLGWFVGSFFGLFYSLTVGPLLGAVLGEMFAGRDAIFTLETNGFRLIGYLGSTFVRMIIGIIIIGSWLALLV